MKLLFLPLAAALSGLAWFTAPRNAATAADDEGCEPCPPAACPVPEDCQVDVECTDDGTCLITCEGPGGKSCEIELACTPDGGCEVVRCDGADCPPTRR
jgi:hypothetical protein